ncbi:MAG TPA: GAF domain-containing protein [Candidatus Cloacimonetes bacterium]|nr:GAF domain-containing protein [Candidatus Cloacimonadota bacterium]
MKNKETLFQELECWTEDLVREKASMLTILQNISKLLKEEVEYYDWVGFYLVDKNNPAELILGPFEGAPTEHTRIPFGQGVCGQVASRGHTIIVQDVSQENNYLSCSINVQSEIVVPIFKEGEFIGEIDIDSHKKAPFTKEDTEFLEHIAQKLSELF